MMTFAVIRTLDPIVLLPLSTSFTRLIPLYSRSDTIVMSIGFSGRLIRCIISLLKLSDRLLLILYTSMLPPTSPVIRIGSPLQKRMIVFGIAFYPGFAFLMEIGSSMFFFYKSLKLNINLPKLHSSIFTYWCKYCWIVGTPFNINYLIGKIQTLKGV